MTIIIKRLIIQNENNIDLDDLNIQDINDDNDICIENKLIVMVVEGLDIINNTEVSADEDSLINLFNEAYVSNASIDLTENITLLDDPEVDLIENITLSDKVKVSEISNPTKVSGVIPSKNDNVLYHDEISDTWKEATVVKRAGKATGNQQVLV